MVETNKGTDRTTRQATIRLVARYAETDQMGIVHHSVYPVWFEAGRTEWLRQSGQTCSEIERRGILLPLYAMSCRFLEPARYEDSICVTVKPDTLTRSRAVFSYEVHAERPQPEESPMGTDVVRVLLATGTTEHAWTDRYLKPVNVGKRIPGLLEVLDGRADTN